MIEDKTRKYRNKTKQMLKRNDENKHKNVCVCECDVCEVNAVCDNVFECWLWWVYNFDLEFAVPLVANCQDGLIGKLPLPFDWWLSVAG